MILARYSQNYIYKINYIICNIFLYNAICFVIYLKFTLEISYQTYRASALSIHYPRYKKAQLLYVVAYGIKMKFLMMITIKLKIYLAKVEK
jgi:hypothetical protein